MIMQINFITCAGCGLLFEKQQTIVYRKKRCCNNLNCINVIDQKVTNTNYKKQQAKIKNGKFRHGVPIDLKKKVYDRDKDICKLCSTRFFNMTKEVHHILPVSENGGDDLVNLILLCNNCHTIVHKEGTSKYYGKFRAYTGSLG